MPESLRLFPIRDNRTFIGCIGTPPPNDTRIPKTRTDREPHEISFNDMPLSEIVAIDGGIHINNPVLFQEMLGLWIQVKHHNYITSTWEKLSDDQQVQELVSFVERLTDPSNTRVMLARNETGQLVGALEYVVRQSGSNLTAPTPSKFRNLLIQNNLPTMPDGRNLIGLNYRYIRPDCQNRGIGEAFYTEIIKMYSPLYMLSWTRSPPLIAAAMAATDGYKEGHYQTYLGGVPLGPYPPNKIVDALLDAGATSTPPHASILDMLAWADADQEPKFLSAQRHDQVELPPSEVEWRDRRLAMPYLLLTLMSRLYWPPLHPLKFQKGEDPSETKGLLYPLIIIDTSSFTRWDTANTAMPTKYTFCLDFTTVSDIREAALRYLLKGVHPNLTPVQLDILANEFTTYILRNNPIDPELLEKLRAFDPYTYEFAFPDFGRPLSELYLRILGHEKYQPASDEPRALYHYMQLIKMETDSE